LNVKINNVYRFILPVITAIVIFCNINLSAQNKDMQYSVSESKILMGTIVKTTVRNSNVNLIKRALKAAYKEMQRVEDLLSSHKKGSEISHINFFAGIRPVKVSFETLTIIKNSLYYSKKSKGLFDVSIGSLSNLWGFSDDNRVIELPDSAEVDSTLRYVGYRNIIINHSDTTVFLKDKNMQLDLGGIAKGYAIDRGSAKLKSFGVINFILNAGGDIYVSGRKDKNKKWTIGIKDPRNTSKIIVVFNLENYAVATSGDYERFRIINGVRYHHILNPYDGYPGRLSESCTVLAPTAEEADALATYFFLLGPQKALKNKSLNIPFLIISTKGKIYYNSLFKSKFNPKTLE